MNNIGLKLFSLMIGILLALFVGSESNSSVLSFFVPVEIRNTPKTKTIIAPQALQVQVSLRGPSFLISRIAASPPTFKVRLPDDIEDRFVATLSKSDLALPPDVQIVSVEPSELELRFDTQATSDLPVIIPKVGSVNDGWILESLIVRPDRVQASGPSRELGSLARLETETLDLRGINSSFSRELQLRAPGGLIQIDRPSVTVEVVVNPIMLPKRFDKLAVEVRTTAGENWIVSPDKVDLELSGTREALDMVKKEQIIPFVRPQSNLNEQTAKVGVDLPAGLSLSVVNPSVVRVQRLINDAKR
jgi:YbbR domain-containing protein